MNDLFIIPKPYDTGMQRSLLVFENAIKSEATKKQYLYQLERFRNWTKINDYDVLLQAPDKEIQVLLEDYLFYLKKKYSPNTIPPIFAVLELFYSMNDKVIDSKKLRKMFPARIKKSGYDAYTNEDVQKMLRHASKKRSRALLLFLASTGCRIGAIADLKIKNLSKMENDCRSVLFYEGSTEEYFSFLTPESSKALDEYLEEREKNGEKLISESPIFRSTYRLGIQKVRPMTTDTVHQVISSLVNSNVSRTKVGSRYNIQVAHGLRKRFATIIKLNNKVSYSISERLLGHQGYLDKEYLRPTKEALFEEFFKVVPELTISDEEREKTLNKKLIIENKELHQKSMEIAELKKNQDVMTRWMMRFKELHPEIFSEEMLVGSTKK